MTYNYNNSLLGDYLSPSGEHLVVENPIIIQSGSINNTTIGNTIPSSGYFSNLSVNGTGVSLTGHTHVVNEITDFNSSVSGLLTVTNVSQGSGILVSENNKDFTISADDNYIDSLIQDNFNTNLIAGNNIVLTYESPNLTISTSGLQPSGDYAALIHTHVSSDITDFNSSVSGLLPVINNSGDNRILTSDGTSTGINAETNLTYSTTRRNSLVVGLLDSNEILNPAKTCALLNASLKVDPSSTNATIGNCETVSSIVIPSGSTISSGNLFGFAVTVGRNVSSGDAGVMGGSSSLIPFSAGYGHFPFGGDNAPVTNTVIGLNLIPFAGAGTINTHYAILIQNVASGVLEPNPIFGSGIIINSYGIFQQNSDPNILNGSLTVNNGLSSPTPILNLGSVSGNVSISYGVDKQIQTLTLNGTATNLIKGSDWPTTFSADVLLEITVSSTTQVSFGFVDDWYNPLPSFFPGKYLVLLRSMGSTIQGHYIGNKTN